MKEKAYIQKLESIIEQVIKPLKGIPFKLVMKSLAGVQVLSFDKNKKEHQELLKTLITVANDVKNEINKKKILSNRVNEVGNKIEPFVKEALIKNGFEADTPKTQNGKRKSTGYPDLEFKYKNKWHYLECKTYNIKSLDTTQRSFFLSPSNNFKITRDALHFLISFEIEKVSNNQYDAKNYKLLSLENLEIDLKNEFNSNNKRLYGKENILYESFFLI